MATKLEKLQKKLIAGGVPEDKALALVTSSASDETIAAVLESLANRDDDYHAQLGRVRSLESDKTRLEQVKKEYDDWYFNVALPAAQKNAQLAANGGQPNPQPTVQPTVPALTLEDVQGLLAKQANNFAGVIKDVGSIASQHAALYKEPLDMDEIEKIATEKKIGVRQAYQSYIEPREKARQSEELSARIKREREEAVKEYATTHGLPAEPVPDQLNYVNKHNIPSDQKSDADINQELLSIWNTEGRKAAYAR